MAASYSIVQYQPDEVTNERVNIGVVVFSNGQVRTHFIDNWQRVRHFARRDIRAVQEFAERASDMSADAFRRAIQTWTHTLRFTEPAPSLKDADELLIAMATRFLVDPAPATRGYRLRNEAVRLARREIRQRLINKLGGIGKLFLKEERQPITGRRSPHPFDITVGNGHPFFAAQAISFEIPDKVKLTRDVDAAAWSIQDVREELPNLPLTVVAIPPKDDYQRELYVTARRTFEGIGAQIVEEAAIGNWAQQMVEATIPAAVQN